MLDIDTLLNKTENAVLEFKRDWYWDKASTKDEIELGWGEFLKDFCSLTNANSRHYNQDRHLVIGVSDDSNIYGMELPEENLELLLRKIKEKIQKFLSFVPNFKLEKKEIDGKLLIVFTISQPKDILKVIKPFKDDKNNISKVNTMYVRGIDGKEDQVDVCDEMEVFRIYENLGIAKDVDIINYKIEYRSIDKAMEFFQEITHLYKLVEGFPKNISDKSLRFKSKLYEFIDEFDNKITFLYVNSSSNIKRLIEKLKSESLLQTKFTLITDQPIDVAPIVRLKNIEDAFKEAGFLLSKIIFLHEFGVNYLYKKNLVNIDFQPFRKNESYVESNAYLRNSSQLKNAHTLLNKWYKEVYKPIIVIQGEGGIGKTTLAKQHVNKIFNQYPDNKIIYMSSSDIVKKIDVNKFENNIVLYDLYNVGSEGNKLNNDLLKFSMDDGKVVLVLDGIDEVISNLGVNFNFDFFIKDIVKEYCFNNGNCKIILTCRNQFWDHLSYSDENNITVIDLVPFDIDQVKEYFEKTFIEKESVSKCLSHTRRFSKGRDTYSPFMLDTVKYLVERNNENKEIEGNIDFDDEIESGVEGSLLSLFVTSGSNSNDLLIRSICNREKIKLDACDLETQLNIFIRLAVDFDGEVDVSKLSYIYPEVDNYKATAIKSHPLLLEESLGGGRLVFKYDFLKLYFEELFIAKNIFHLNSNKVDLGFIKSLKNIGYANQLSNNILNRVENKIKGSELSFIEYCALNLIEINNLNDEFETKIMYSNFFVLCIYLYVRIFGKEPDDFISSVLGNSNIIENLYLINVSSSYGAGKKLFFNFENKIIKNSILHNYDYLWYCRFNDSTRFLDTVVRDIRNKPPRDTSISIKTFENCTKDIKFQEYLSDLFDSKKNIKTKSRTHILKILKIFVSNGNFLPQKVVKVKADTSRFSGDNCLDKLLKYDVIIKHDSHMLENEYVVAEDYHVLLDAVTQGNNSNILDKLVELVTNN